MHEPQWFAAFLFCAIVWCLLRLIPTVGEGEKAAERRERLTQAVLVAALVYLILWALGTSGPFVAWR